MDDYRNSPKIKFCADSFPAPAYPFGFPVLLGEIEPYSKTFKTFKITACGRLHLQVQPLLDLWPYPNSQRLKELPQVVVRAYSMTRLQGDAGDFSES